MPTPIIAKEEVLERVDGDIEFLTELTQTFLASFPTQLADLSASAEQSDALQTERKAHSIKGALRNLGGARSGETAQQIESAARQGNLTETKQMLQELENRVKEFESEFYAFLLSMK